MKSGIYQLKSKLTEEVYIGLSKDVYYRAKKHIEMLKRGKHFNIHLQRHFNKYGDDLEFSVLEFCEQEKMEEREIFWIKKLEAQKNGFNLSEGGKLKEYTAKHYDFENIWTGEVKLDKTVKEMREYDSSIDSSSLSKAIRGKWNHCHGWKIKGRELKEKKKCPLCIKMLRPITLKNIKTGEIKSFPSQIEAARQLKIKQGSLSYLAKKKRHTCGIWELG